MQTDSTSGQRARLAREDTDIDELYRQLDAHVEGSQQEMEAALASLAGVTVHEPPPSVRLRHATTDARFDTAEANGYVAHDGLRLPTGMPRTERSVDANLVGLAQPGHGQAGALQTPGGMPLSQAKDSGTRFDSHNILRSEETADLFHLPEEQIWQKRDEAGLKESAEVLEMAAGPCGGSAINMAAASSAPARHSVEREAASARSSYPYPKPTISTSQSEHYDLQQRGTLPTSGTGLTHLLSPGDLDDYQYARRPSTAHTADTGSLLSSERSKDTTKKSSKSLTRRLSSFFTRSFRKKRSSAGTPTTPGAESKRVYYSASSYDERPGSAATRLSLEDSEYVAQRSQQLLRLGFSLNIEEALAQEPDSFVFVPLTDSGYFSSDCDELEKLPEVSVTDTEEETSTLPDSTPRPTPPPRHTNPASQRSRPTALRTMSAGPSRLSDGHSQVHPLTRQTATGTPVQSMGSPASYDGVSVAGHRREMGRRLSFIEGTSVMESINHLAGAYPSEVLLEQHFTLEDGSLPPASRRAREKLRFKRHPWKWIKSKF